MDANYTYEELVERVEELENTIFNLQMEMQGFIKSKDIEIHKLKASTSWRITKPLRLTKKVLKKIFS